MKLTNTVSWSKSRMDTLRACPRQYRFAYYDKWGGWEPRADIRTERIYVLSKMTTLPMLVGNVVHRRIKDAILGASSDPFEVAVRHDLTEAWNAARSKLWKRRPAKHPPISELWYGPLPTAAELKAIGNRAASLTRSFLASCTSEEIQAGDPEDFLLVDPAPFADDTPVFELDGMRVWALPDFARRVDGDRVEIWDWKTGRSRDEDEDQLRAYGLAVSELYDVPPEKIDLFAFYLGEQHVERFDFGPAARDAIEARITGDRAVMEGLLEDVAGNVPKAAEAFEMNPRACGRCSFREVCEMPGGEGDARAV